jgi:hypothetical protein
MGTFSKLLKQSNDASNAVCDNPTKANCRELELVTDLAIQALTEEIKRRKNEKDRPKNTMPTDNGHLPNGGDN